MPPEVTTTLSATNLGFWIQTGAFVLSAIGAIAVIFYNGRVSRQRATVDLVLHQKADSDLINALSMIYAMKRNNENLSVHLPTLQSDQGKCIRLVLNSYEFVALGIRVGAFDEQMFKEMQCSNYVKVWEATRGLIQDIRQQQQKETFFQEFEWLAKRWIKKPLKKRHS
ncbi:DUF4760 domain-containing protein [Schauerella aestuarii]|uniref:DUF4760 domain-containing protein n=1 Tax=Schauerella aestuarii TaxID=2511204 RepID=UPI001367CFAC|nr:DUF4760 domain-containing protein [Achromobacter aestuarii]MYZ41393.1 DUF4760 domain-containing protein [Achromobacter aestuarii]